MNLKLLSLEINVLFDECDEPRMRLLVRTRDFVDTLDMNMKKKVLKSNSFYRFLDFGLGIIQ